MRLQGIGMLASVLLLSSCGDFMEVRQIRPKGPAKEEGDPGNGGMAAGLAAGAAGANAGVKKINEDVAAGVAPEEAGYLPFRVEKGTKVKGMLLPSDDEIVWAEMDKNAEVKLGDAFIEKPKRSSSWHFSFQEARRESMRTGKPLLIWFTRTGSPGSPMCARLKRELFGDHDFGKWADEKLVRLKVDASGGDKRTDEFGQLDSTLVARRKYAEKLKKQFNVIGHPTLVVVQPDGSVYLQERGYSRGDDKELWGKLKNAVLTIAHNRGIWERKMAAKGYRRWKGKNGTEVFARLLRYREPYLLLAEPDGNKIKTSQKDLSKDDRGWIIAEKKKRGL